MQCDNCKEREAVINLTQVEHDSKVTLHLCEQCAQEKGVETGVAVLGKHFWAAKQGRDALVVDWDLGEGAKISTDGLRADYRKLAQTPGAVAKKAGDVDAALKAGKVIEAEYEVPFLAHATMEPMNCTVHVRSDRCEIWVGSSPLALLRAA